MSKKEERARIIEVIDSPDFEKACEAEGFTICSNAEEGKPTKKKANI